MHAYTEDRREPRALLYVWPRGRREPARTFVRVYLCRKEARARFQHGLWLLTASISAWSTRCCAQGDDGGV
jgi:hypothetical protein